MPRLMIMTMHRLCYPHVNVQPGLVLTSSTPTYSATSPIIQLNI
jgi:hypothetical protein